MLVQNVWQYNVFWPPHAEMKEILLNFHTNALIDLMKGENKKFLERNIRKLFFFLFFKARGKLLLLRKLKHGKEQ